MMRTILAPAVLAGLLALATSSQVHAYGACRGKPHLHQPLHGQKHDRRRGHGLRPQRGLPRRQRLDQRPQRILWGHGSHAYSPTMYGGYTGAGVEHGYGAAVVRYP